MAAGNALLALAGPVGWAIGGATIVGSALIASSENAKLAKEADTLRMETIQKIAHLEKVENQLNKIIVETNIYLSKVNPRLDDLIDIMVAATDVVEEVTPFPWNILLFFLKKGVKKTKQLYDEKQLYEVSNGVLKLSELLDQRLPT